MRLPRRLALAAAGVAALAGCAREEPPRGGDDGGGGAAGERGGPVTGAPGSPQVVAYGDDPAQFAELTRPPGRSRGVVVVIHGGFWKAAYGLDLGRPLAEDLVGRGWTTWNIEYRRVGGGGGYPETLDDVHAAIERLADLDVDTATVVTLGHSAGGHLATWAAARGRFEPWPTAVPVTHVVSQAGVLDLGAASDEGLGGGAADAFLGSGDDAVLDRADPTRQLPLDVPVWCVHGRSDAVVPPSQSSDYVERARAAGAEAELVEVDGDHFVVIDPGSPAWARIVEVLDGIG